MLVAANEVFGNALRHGDGPTALRAGLVDGWFVCEIEDEGPGIDDPLAGYLPPTPGRSGRGGPLDCPPARLASGADPGGAGADRQIVAVGSPRVSNRNSGIVPIGAPGRNRRDWGMEIGLLHPGEMGAAIGAALVSRGQRVAWASAGRSQATRERADRAGLDDVGEVAHLCRRCDFLISVCPPHAAADVARQVEGFAGIYLDANAVSPETARRIGHRCRVSSTAASSGRLRASPEPRGSTCPAQRRDRSPRCSKTRPSRRRSFRASPVRHQRSRWPTRPGQGQRRAPVATRSLARAEGVEQTFVEEWRMSQPGLDAQSVAASRSAVAKGWRWVGEMHEIASKFAASGLPREFHDAAAEVYRRASQQSEVGEPDLDRLLEAIRDPRPMKGRKRVRCCGRHEHRSFSAPSRCCAG